MKQHIFNTMTKFYLVRDKCGQKSRDEVNNHVRDQILVARRLGAIYAARVQMGISIRNSI